MVSRGNYFYTSKFYKDFTAQREMINKMETNYSLQIKSNTKLSKRLEDYHKIFKQVNGKLTKRIINGTLSVTYNGDVYNDTFTSQVDGKIIGLNAVIAFGDNIMTEIKGLKK